ncbi:GDSL esterase/lipase 1 isoform X2 [Ricinus communis]|uniref:GDSL esterase/lipase 1 isoform X2 n=1 Tax=Ricinus communis TaxID=3988 RepID=UPI000D69FC8B|nr:GDSL esterase/lipase 1 isoform X2 [Ricinus communis]|eukprot:XP_025015571.1 GDSL esterase/lipase 1 isoform X2 [Ricinus communis]
MSSIRFQVYFLLALCAVLVIPKSTKAHPHPEEFQNHVALFVFGDSLFDVGNNNYLKNPIGLANFWPYGETFFNHPTGRFCDGRLISDFLAEYLKLPLILPYLQPGVHQFTNGVNFASGGAGALVETHEGRVVDLKTQVLYLKNVKKQISKQIGDEETKTLLSKAIYLISIGGNEYLAPSHVFKSFSREDYVRMVIGNLTSVIKDIYKIGGRKFVFVGFKEANVACCGAGLYRGILSSCGLVKGYEVCDDVSDYVFFDSVHSTEKTYKQLAKLIWTGGHNVSKPCNLKTMVEA